MPQDAKSAIKEWAAPALLVALVSVCGILWVDMRTKVDKLSDNMAALQIAVTRLTVLQEEEAKRLQE